MSEVLEAKPSVAKFNRHRCWRCGKPIMKGQEIESWKPEGTGQTLTVHLGCTDIASLPTTGEGDIEILADKAVDIIAKKGLDAHIKDAVESIKQSVGDELAEKLSSTIDSTITSLAGAVAKVVTGKLEAASLEMATYVKQRIDEARLPARSTSSPRTASRLNSKTRFTTRLSTRSPSWRLAARTSSCRVRLAAASRTWLPRLLGP